MRKIEDWENVEEAGDFKKLPKGIYPIVIKQVTDKADKEYLEVLVDIVQGEFKNYFSEQYKQFETWSNAGITRRSYKPSAERFFKSFITAIEKSNTGYKWNWNEATLVGKYAYGIWGEEEYLDKDGNVQIAVKLQEIRSVEAFKKGELKVPELKKLKVEDKPKESVKFEVEDDDLPF